MTTNQLFQPFRLKSLRLKNRIVMAPMTARSLQAGCLPQTLPIITIAPPQGKSG